MLNGVWWYENPGEAGGRWKATKIVASDWTEGLVVEDIDGDGDADVLVNHWAPKEGQGLTWLEFEGKGKFEVHVLGKEGDTHGGGIGDLDGDGRKDIITPHGWWRAPENRSGEAWNEAAFSNKEFDDTLTAALAVADVDKRREMVAKCEKIMQDEGVICQPYWRTLTNFTKSNLKGAGHHISFEFHPAEIYWEA